MAASIDEFPQGENAEKLNIAEHFVDAPAASHPGRLAIVGEPREVTYGELAALANRAGNALHSNGVSRGDRVLIVLPDSAEFVAVFFGAAKWFFRDGTNCRREAYRSISENPDSCWSSAA